MNGCEYSPRNALPESSYIDEPSPHSYVYEITLYEIKLYEITLYEITLFENESEKGCESDN